MGNAPLALDDDYARSRFVVGADDFGFQFAHHEIGLDRVERHPVSGSLEEPRLARGHERGGDARSVQRIRQQEGRRPLPDRPVRPEDRDPEAWQLAGEIAELLRLPDWPRLADVDQAYALGLRELHEFRIVVEELVQSRDDVQAMLDRLADDRPELLRNVPAECRATDDQGPRRAPTHGFLQVRDDRDPVRFSVEDLPGVMPGLRMIDDARDLVPFRIPHEAVRRLSRALTEISVAQDDGFLHASCPLC